jgi:glycosidase
VVNYTSDQHPWFQAARRNDPKYNGYYVWRKDDPGDASDQAAFPGKQSGVWEFDKLAKAYYFHRFYSYQPDLWEKTFDHFIHLFDERPNEKIKKAEIGLELSGFGFSWLRLRQKKQI